MQDLKLYKHNKNELKYTRLIVNILIPIFFINLCLAKIQYNKMFFLIIDLKRVIVRVTDEIIRTSHI